MVWDGRRGIGPGWRTFKCETLAGLTRFVARSYAVPIDPVITFFTRPECSLCDAALFVLRRVRAAHPFELVIVNIDEPGRESWHEAYGHDIPVVHLDGVEIFRHRVDERRLRVILRGEH